MGEEEGVYERMKRQMVAKKQREESEYNYKEAHECMKMNGKNKIFYKECMKERVKQILINSSEGLLLSVGLYSLFTLLKRFKYDPIFVKRVSILSLTPIIYMSYQNYLNYKTAEIQCVKYVLNKEKENEKLHESPKEENYDDDDEYLIY